MATKPTDEMIAAVLAAGLASANTVGIGHARRAVEAYRNCLAALREGGVAPPKKGA